LWWSPEGRGWATCWQAAALKILSEGWVLLLGGILCIVVAWMVARWQSGFLKYDARNPFRSGGAGSDF
jgi:hypothetical protein